MERDGTAQHARPRSLPPHSPLVAYYSNEDERQRFVRRLFDATAADYDRVEALLAWGSGSWYRRQALRRAGLGPGMHVVDVGTGTGLLAREALELCGAQGSLVGVDPSPGMMAQARLPQALLLQGRAEALPCADAGADFVSMGYALRHLSDVDQALSEFRRVLRPGGRLLMLEITRPRSAVASWLLKRYMRTLVPVAARLLTHHADTATLWRYYWDTIEACIAPERVLDAMRRAGFDEVGQHLELGIFREYAARKGRAA
ncbi:MAG TPA: class I SAM-dependent methyltransferase [Burkholderiaceae bacterium]|nr:class I SAM-dependent methyltransferase [Burkholderiaceae bacterium]